MSTFDENSVSAAMDRYSRQIGTYGVETMINLANLSVLIVGATGAGFETAKNLILAGPKAVALFDPNPIKIEDLGVNCFFSKESVGKKRDAVCAPQLAVLNPYVEVSVFEQFPTPENIGKFGAVVITDSFLPLNTLIGLNEHCRKHNIVFLMGLVNGFVCTIFSDFGDTFFSKDLTGEPERIIPIERFIIEKKEETKAVEDVQIEVNTASHRLEDDSLIRVSGNKVFEEMGTTKIKRIYTTYDNGKRQRLDPKRFIVDLNENQKEEVSKRTNEIKDTGFVIEEKKSKEFHFLSLEKALTFAVCEEDMFIPCPAMAKMFLFRGECLHFARLGIWEFAKQKGSFPRLHNMDDANEVLKYANERLEAHRKIENAVVVDKLDEFVVRSLSLFYRTELIGLCTFAGGVLAQEIVKKFGKFTPMPRWLQLDFLEMAPQGEICSDFAPQNCRYDHLIAMFGKKVQEKLTKMNWFMVGCGALGCEYLKAFALLGIGTSEKSCVSVTDMDRIEVSNLSRQFLFRRENVGQQKAACAANAAKVFNPEFNVVCYETKVCPETESSFNDAFWERLDGVCNALDNIPTRKYVDSRCVFYEKPLLESGTEGTKANSEVVLPFKTCSYNESQEAEAGEGIPMCTLRNFPHLIDHCIEWARAQFTDLFESPVKDIKALIGDEKKSTNPIDDYLKSLEKEGTLVAKLAKLKASLSLLIPFDNSGKPTFRTCMDISLKRLYEDHTKRIEALTQSFPQDAISTDPDTGEKRPFWSGSKRFPRAVYFGGKDNTESDDEAIASYLFACSNLYANVYNVPQMRDFNEFKKFLAGIKDEYVKQYDQWLTEDRALRSPKESSLTKASDEAIEEALSDTTQQKEYDDAIAQLRRIISTTDVADLGLQGLEFEKDDDTNFHVDFITACANKRAWNYHIEPASRFQCKMIAGKIIPALATTTALITGLVSIEMIKLALNMPKAQFDGANVNLAINSYTLFEPPDVIKAVPSYDEIEMCDVKPVPNGFTCWDKVVVDTKGLTVGEFVEKFPQFWHGVSISMLLKANLPADAMGNTFLYTSFAPTKTIKEAVEKYKTMLFKDAYAELYNEDVSQLRYVIMEGSYELNDEPVKIPSLKCLL